MKYQDPSGTKETPFPLCYLRARKRDIEKRLSGSNLYLVNTVKFQLTFPTVKSSSCIHFMYPSLLCFSLIEYRKIDICIYIHS